MDNNKLVTYQTLVNIFSNDQCQDTNILKLVKKPIRNPAVLNFLDAPN